MSYATMFEAAGKFVKLVNFMDMLSDGPLEFTNTPGTYKFTSLDQFRQEFATVLNQGDAERDGLRVFQALSDFISQARGFRARALSHLDELVRQGFAEELGMQGSSARNVLLRLRSQMTQDSESVQANTVSVGSVSDDGSNAGTGSVFVFEDTTLPDGSIVDDEMIATQDIEMVCTYDAPHDGRDSGDEEFTLVSETAQAVQVPVIAATGPEGDANDRNLLMDGSFESHDGADFEHWEVAAGAALFSQEDSTVYVGDASLEVTSAGGTAGQLEQDLSDAELMPGEFYAIAANVHVDSLSAGSITIRLEGDGYSSTAELTIDGGTGTGTWLKLCALELVPKPIPENMALVVEVDSAFAGTVFIDNVALARPTPIPALGIRVAVFQGDEDFVAGSLPDAFSFSLTSSDTGVFQTFLRDNYRMVLPSSGSPTIADTYAE